MEWSGVDTPQTVMTTRAPAVLTNSKMWTQNMGMEHWSRLEAPPLPVATVYRGQPLVGSSNLTSNIVTFLQSDNQHDNDYISGLNKPLSLHLVTQIREGVKKKLFFWDFVPNYGQVGVQSPKPFSENNHSAIFTVLPFFLGLCPKIGVAVGGWGSRVPNKYMEPCPKNLTFFSKKQNALNSLKNKTNLTFTSHLVESQTWAVGGRGSMFGTKSQKKTFFLTPSLS